MDMNKNIPTKWGCLILVIFGLLLTRCTYTAFNDGGSEKETITSIKQTSTLKEETDTKKTTTKETTSEAPATEAPTAPPATEPPVTEPPATNPPVTEEDTPIGMRNALKSAKNYLSFTAFSRQGLIEQLEYEGYANEEAVYAVDNCGADWNEQAMKSAQNYIDLMAFSREGLIDQLIYEGYTEAEAEYGVQAIGY